MDNLKILVTGGAGFIGSNLVDRLVKEGHDVVVIDDLSTGKKEYVNENARFYQIDVRDSDVFRVFRRESFDVVYHLASQSDPRKGSEDAVEDSSINIVGTVNIAKNCAEYGVKKLIMSSTMAVYEDDNREIDEFSEVEPISLNAYSKKSAEDYVRYFATEYDFEYCILRYSNVYGVRQSSLSDGGIIYMTLDKIYAKSVPLIFGEMDQKRDFIFVMDVIEANIQALSYGSNETYNVAYGIGVTQRDLCEMIINKVSPGLKTMVHNPRYGDMNIGSADISKAKIELKWEPVFCLEDGIEITTQYYKREKGR